MTALPSPGHRGTPPVRYGGKYEVLAVWARRPSTHAMLAGGAYLAGAVVEPSRLSRHNPQAGTAGATVPLSMQVVDAILATLAGCVSAISSSRDGCVGRVGLATTASAKTMSWDGRAPDLCFGGSVGGAAYHVGVAALVMLLAQRRLTPATDPELEQRWAELTSLLGSTYPSSSQHDGWDADTLAAACADNAVRAAIEGVADALVCALRCALPSRQSRSVYAQYTLGLAPHEGTELVLSPLSLLGLWAAGTTTIDPDEDIRALLVGQAEDSMANGDVSVMATDAAADKDTPLIVTAAQARITRAYERSGPFFMYGQTASGKTTWAIRHSQVWGDGCVLVVFKPGVTPDNLFGSWVNDPAGWTWKDGPLVSWARRVTTGEKLALILDELPRGEKSVLAVIMDLLNVYTAAEVAAQKLELPALPGPYHIVRVPDHLEQVYVLPISRARVVGTGNQGDRYVGLDLSDPAFRRRWTAGWLELEDMTARELVRILGAHLRLSPQHTLVQALVHTHEEIKAYQARDFKLVMPTNLSILIAWGKEVVRHVNTAEAPTSTMLAEAFRATAQDMWLDMIVPVNGERKDGEVYQEVLAIIADCSPTRGRHVLRRRHSA